MDDYNRLLQRQIRRHLKGVKEIPDEFKEVFQAISDSFDHHDSDRTLIERSLEISSKELNEAYKKIKVASKEIEEKNRHIMDSIRYAKQIQEAILPQQHVVENYLKDHFIFYSPKDIVSGDFYWMEQLEDGRVMVAAVDCTGHGVPGAFMSMIGNSLLNETVKEKKIFDPGEVLNRMKAGVMAALKQTGEIGESRDGMDMALYSLDQQNMKLEFAGAYNPVFIFRKTEGSLPNEEDFPDKTQIFDYGSHHLIRLVPNKFPIGWQYGADHKKFDTQRFDLQEGDTLYVFSDGYVDQFGGPKKRKFSTRAFRDLLASIQGDSMAKQKAKVELALNDWKGEGEQIDDVLVIGVKV